MSTTITQQLVKMATELIRIPSIYPNEAVMQKFLYDYFTQKGYKATSQKVAGNRYNLIVERQRTRASSGNKTIVLYSHMDTVPVTGAWIKGLDPHTPRVKGDKLYGLGAYDMKGGMAVNIKTFEDLAQENLQNINVKLVFTVDEENISEGGHALVNSKHMNNVACIISPEPAFLYGVNGITTGRMGRCVFDLELHRESIHTAFYHPKDDLNRVLAEITLVLENLYHLEAGKKQFLFFRTIESHTSGMSLPNKINTTIEASLIPPHTALSVERDLHSKIKSILKKFDKGISYSLSPINRKTPFLNPYEIEPDNAYAQVLAKSVKRITHKKAHMYFRSSVADDNIFGSQGITVLGIGPEGDRAHAPNEWVSISSMEKLYHILVDFIKNCDSVI